MDADQLELNYLRRVLIGMIEVTVEDMTNDKKYQSKNKKADQALNKREALEFIRSRAFDTVCDAVGIPACRVRTKCLS